MGPVPRMQMVATGSRGSCGRETDTSACLPILGHTLVGAAYMPARSARSRRLSAMWALALLAVCPAGTRDLTARIRQTAAPTATAPPSSTAASDIVRTYCVTCHNGRLKTAGLELDSLDAAHVGDHAEQWEKIARKLRTGEMPPPGRPRPDAEPPTRRRGGAGTRARRGGGGAIRIRAACRCIA